MYTVTTNLELTHIYLQYPWEKQREKIKNEVYIAQKMIHI